MEKVSLIVTQGTPAMIGKNRGLLTRIKQKNKRISLSHAPVHVVRKTEWTSQRGYGQNNGNK